MQTYEQPALGWTVVLRRCPVRSAEDRVQGGYTNIFEIICCDCGDHPDWDYRDVSRRGFGGSAALPHSRGRHSLQRAPAAAPRAGAA